MPMLVPNDPTLSDPKMATTIPLPPDRWLDGDITFPVLGHMPKRPHIRNQIDLKNLATPSGALQRGRPEMAVLSNQINII
jgi:hypothetical protein